MFFDEVAKIPHAKSVAMSFVEVEDGHVFLTTCFNAVEALALNRKEFTIFISIPKEDDFNSILEAAEGFRRANPLAD